MPPQIPQANPQRPDIGPSSCRLLYYTADHPALDLALEESIQRGMETGATGTTWRVWSAARAAVVLGTGQQHAVELDMDAVQAAGVPVLRRHSGGGAVLIGPGVINYSGFYLFDRLAGSQTITGAMEAGLQPVLRTLAVLGVPAQFAGLSDLAVCAQDGTLRKLAGNSQARKRMSVLVHGTLLADPDWGLMGDLLRFPSKSPDYRAGRDHHAFLASLRKLNAPQDPDSFLTALQTAVGPNYRLETKPTDAELELAQKLKNEKYGSQEWNLRR